MRVLSRGGSIGGRDASDPTVPDHRFHSKHKFEVYRVFLHEVSEPTSPAHYWLYECSRTQYQPSSCNHAVLKF
jgi:hypothetical protein